MLGFSRRSRVRLHGPQLAGRCFDGRRTFSPLVPIHDALVAVHDTTGFPWWITIPFSTTLLSLITLPIAVRSRLQQRKLVALRTIVEDRVDAAAKELKATKSTESFTSFHRALNARSRSIRRTVHRDHGVSMASLLLLPALKIPLWLTFSMTLRSMSGSPIPFFTPLSLEQGLQTEGVAFIHDLSTYDSTLCLPVAFGLLNLLNIELTSSRYEEGRLRRVVSNAMRGVSVMFIYVASQMPAAVCLYWVTSVVCTITQNVVLDWKYPPVQHQSDSPKATKVERLTLPSLDDEQMMKVVVDDAKDEKNDRKKEAG